MKFSVVIPCYNAQPYIGQALASVKDQLTAPCETIVIDDGSTDGSVSEVQNAPLDVVLLSTHRANGAGARNAGIRAAHGDWIAFLDADDVWFPDHLQRVVQLLGGTSDVAYLASTALIFGDGSAHQRKSRFPIRKPSSGLTHRDYMRACCEKFYYAMSPVVIRRDVLLKIGGLDEQLRRRHDIDMWLRAIHGRTWSFDPVSSTAYRIGTPNSISSDIANREFFFLRALQKNRQAYADSGIDQLIRMSARRALAAAYTDGDADDRARAWRAGGTALSRWNRFVFSTVRCCPWLFRSLNRRRRLRLARSRALT